MPEKRTCRIPSLCRHKATDQAYVKLNGRRIYLGRYGTAEAEQRYHRTVSEWLARGRRPSVDPHEITIAELLDAFWEHARSYYRKANGEPTSEISCLILGLRPLLEIYGRTSARDFRPTCLLAIQEKLIDIGVSRGVVNAAMDRIRRVFKWGAGRELIGADVYQALRCVPGLRRGRSRARETEPVRPVPEANIEAIKPHVSRQVAAIIDLQLLTGARAGELVGLRPIDIDTTRNIWAAELNQHKTAHHGSRRTLYFGPRSIAILRAFMDRPVDACLFNASEAEADRHAAALTHRRPDQPSNPRKTDRAVRDRYDVGSYRRCIARACDAAGVPRWNPHRLRHNAATRLRRDFGIDLAQTILGHRLGSTITELYAEANVAKALEVVGQVG